MTGKLAATRAVLLRRQGLVVVEPSSTTPIDEVLVQAVGLELANLGFAPSTRLLDALRLCTPDALAALSHEMQAVLAKVKGADVTHRPLFRSFPQRLPSDLRGQWAHWLCLNFAEADDQLCLFCAAPARTHVVEPCHHVVCDACWPDVSFTACPQCGGRVSPSSPFAQRAKPRMFSSKERVKLSRLDVTSSIEAPTRAWFEALCARTQAMSPVDKDDLRAIVADFGVHVLPWLPSKIPARENKALVLGVLFQTCAAEVVLPAARTHLTTATDVLRMLAVISGADPGLQGERRTRVERTNAAVPSRALRSALERLSKARKRARHAPLPETVSLPVVVKRFKMAKLRRPLRRALLQLLDALNPELLVEDMLRHRSYWVWVGQFLHPGEHAARFENVARAFEVVRRKAPDGTRAPPAHTFTQRLEAAAAKQDARAFVDVVKARPGELARRFDHALRLAGDDVATRTAVVETFAVHASAFATPVLLTLAALLPARAKPAPVWLVFPKGGTGQCMSLVDDRPLLSADVVQPALRVVEGALLSRFAEKPAFDDVVIDDALAHVCAPFNERTASRGAVALPRGSRLALPRARTLRMFLHWCEPENGGLSTDIDLSVAFYDARWAYLGMCSYSELHFKRAGRSIAKSSGDLRHAPFPEGASEFVDVEVQAARDCGARYAVMVVNAYSGMPFSTLQRAFAGLMHRDDITAAHFDPRTVELKFDLTGEHGVFVPLAVDLDDNALWWIDTYSKGEVQFNNVASSNRDIQKVCPETIAYFGSGARCSMRELALLHAAARGKRVHLRGDDGVRRFERRAGEEAAAFLRRLRHDAPDAADATLDVTGPCLAALLRGDVALPAGSSCYALFREGVAAPLAAADLLS